MGVKVNFSYDDNYWQQRALQLAKKAAQQGEVPVGAVLVLNNELVSEGYNQSIMCHDPTAHAEIVALRIGAERIGNYRLLNTSLYVTLEPCSMCAGAMVHARIRRLIFGAHDLRAGAIASQSVFFSQGFLNHRVECVGGLLADQCGDLLSQFFSMRR
jgi:tRNA(adenine34) deaminase